MIEQRCCNFAKRNLRFYRSKFVKLENQKNIGFYVGVVYLICHRSASKLIHQFPSHISNACTRLRFEGVKHKRAFKNFRKQNTEFPERGKTRGTLNLKTTKIFWHFLTNKTRA